MEPTALNIRSRPLPEQPSRAEQATDIQEPKALNIASRPKDEHPKALNIVSTPKTQTYTENKKFDLSYEYLKSKVPITTFIYSQIKPILEKVERTNQNRQDTDVLNFGKKTTRDNISKIYRSK